METFMQGLGSEMEAWPWKCLLVKCKKKIKFLIFLELNNVAIQKTTKYKIEKRNTDDNENSSLVPRHSNENSSYHHCHDVM